MAEGLQGRNRAEAVEECRLLARPSRLSQVHTPRGGTTYVSLPSHIYH